MNFWKSVFSDNGSPSASRVLTMLHSLCAVGVVANYSVHNHGAIPDIATMGGLGVFATVHYAVNRFSQGIGQASPATDGK
jgi:hypothetical protein